MTMLTLGSLGMGLALIAAIVAIGSLWWGQTQGKDGEGITNIGYIATYVTLLFTTMATFVLLAAFLRNDFTFQYVAFNHPTDVSAFSWMYKISGVWAGREGSLLFWEWILSIFAAWVAWRRISETDALSNVALAIINAVQVFFLAALFFPLNDPFKAIDPGSLGPNGELLINAAMNPLLQTWAMAIHPPTLFIGYAGLTVPFAFAVAAIILNDGSKRWVQLSDRITVFSWLFLGIGIGLGSVWAYIELAFGGYWAWDPVENASFLPWLTGVALLHSMTVYRRRESFKVWTVVMATVTFAMVILGTFITRSGIVQSVHAFEQDALSYALFLSLIVAALVAGIGGVIWRRQTFKSSTEFESLLSKESSYYFNNVIMLIASLLVAYWTLAPALPTWLPAGGQTFGATAYDAVARPVGILYIFIMAVCPILAWGVTEPSTFWKRVRWPLGIAAVLAVGFMAIWYTQLMPHVKPELGVIGQVYGVAGLLVAALAIALPLYLFFDGARKKAAASGVGFGSALLSIFTKARTQSGGYLTHVGMGLILFGLIGSTIYVQDYKAVLPQKPGATVKAGPYTLTFDKIEKAERPNKDKTRTVTFDVTLGGQKIGTLQATQVLPIQVLTDLQGQEIWENGRREVAIQTNALRDLFVIFESVDAKGNAVLNFKINPLIVWVWIGFVILIAGTTLAVWPKRGQLAI
jgi:cytochrome c-type biogenesis protein CcmF